MSLFLSKENQRFTKPVLFVGLACLPEDKWLNVITALYQDEYDGYTEYYLFDKIKIWKK